MQDKGKARRQQKILSLIRSRELSTQSELVTLLEKAGFEATQSSVSRDLVELGIVKQRGLYAVPRVGDAGVGSRFLSIKTAGDALLVVRCVSGFASATTVAIDQEHLPGIVGTIAGDDTIFIAVEGKQAQKEVMTAILGLFEGNSELLNPEVEE